MKSPRRRRQSDFPVYIPGSWSAEDGLPVEEIRLAFEVEGVRCLTLASERSAEYTNAAYLAYSVYLQLHQHERGLGWIAGLLSPEDRERYLVEWRDHLMCVAESGGNPRRVLWSLLWRSVLPLVLRSRSRALRRTLSRG